MPSNLRALVDQAGGHLLPYTNYIIFVSIKLKVPPPCLFADLKKIYLSFIVLQALGAESVLLFCQTVLPNAA